jgi:hypothetical protein
MVDEQQPEVSCSQCGKPAMFKAAGQFLCLHCYNVLNQTNTQQQQAQNDQLRNLMSLHNLFAAEFDYISGIPGTPRIQIPQPPVQATIQQGPMTFNNFSISESKIGVINTGDVQRIDVAMENLKQIGAAELVSALQEFTQSVLNCNEIQPDQKNQVLEQVAEVTDQVTLPAQNRKKGIIKALIEGIRNSALTVTAVSEAWTKLQPLLESFLNIT